MKTISTLCATSTVGIAPCGLALGRPRELQHEDRFTSTTRSSASPSPSTGSRSISTDRYTASPSSLSIDPPSTSTSRRKSWFRRLSESLRCWPAASSHASSTPASSVSTSKARSRSVTTPSPGTSIRNKLVKRVHSRAASPALALSPSPPISTPLTQPATALARDQSPLSPISVHRPATTLPESECDSDLRTYDPQPVASWRIFFTAKKHHSKSAIIKRIYPDCLHHPTLVLAHVISDEPSDTSSVYSGQSIYYDTHPPSSVMSQLSTFDHPTSTSVQGIKIRRSFSISNILHSPRLPSRHSRRHSSAPACNWIPQPTPYHTPSENFPPSPLPRPYPSEFQHLPPIQSVSVLNCDIEQEATTTAPICDERDSPSDSSSVCGSLVSCEEGDNVNNENNNDNANDNDNNNDNGNILQTDSIYGPHRLSLLTNAGSERASTLIGSDDGLAIENPYDSVRTRVNEGVTPPVRVESLFDLSSSPPDMSASVALKKTRGAPFVDEIDNVSPTSDVFRGLTPPPVKLDEWLSNRQDDNDDINWGSDWEMPKNSRADDVPFGGVPMNARRSESSASFLKAGLRHDNGSRSSFEDWTTEWDNGGDSNSNLGSSPASIRQGATTWRSKTTYTKGKSASTVAQKEGSAPNSLHTRSQSLPVRSSARHMASESWDSDFEDDESGLGGGEVVVPQAIQERQQKVLRHLDSVKEFAALVQELKKLHELALSTGVRWGQHEKMWDEAEGIIALASVGAEEEEKRGRQRDNEISGLSSLNDESTDEDEDVRRVMSEESRNSQITVTTRRTSILLPDDDIFGGNNLESLFTEPNNSLERLPSRHVKSYSTSSTDSRKAATIGRSDPLALARSIMERIQRGPSDSLYPGTGSSTMSRNSKVHFDTKMLGPLLEKVRKLLGSLQDTLKDEGEFGLYRC